MPGTSPEQFTAVGDVVVRVFFAVGVGTFAVAWADELEREGERGRVRRALQVMGIGCAALRGSPDVRKSFES